MLADISDGSVRAQLEKYVDCIQQWSAHINLTGAESRSEVVATLVRPILGGEAYLGQTVVDVGSGNGSPALVLASLRPDVTFTLLEPRAKRWAFLRQAVREMGLQNTTVRRERSEQYAGPRVQTVTMRAVGLNPAALTPLLEKGGSVIVFGGPRLDGAERVTLASGAALQRICFT